LQFIKRGKSCPTINLESFKFGKFFIYNHMNYKMG